MHQSFDLELSMWDFLVFGVQRSVTLDCNECGNNPFTTLFSEAFVRSLMEISIDGSWD
jgi:hypothetical protein